MSTEKLESQLRRLHAPDPDLSQATPRAERELLARFDAAYPSRGRWAQLVPRLGLAGLGVGLLAGACALPADLNLDLGVALHLNFAGDEELPVHAIAEFCKNELGAKDITVEMSMQRDEGSGSTTTVGSLDLELWGPSLDPDLVVPALQAEFTQLAPLTIDSQPLSGSVRTNLGGKFMHDYLDVDRFLDDEDLQSARAQVLAELRARGVQGEIEIDIEQVGDRKAVRIGVRQFVEDSADSGDSGETGGGHQVNLRGPQAP